MSVNKANVRHVIRNGVPESIIAWAQEFGRDGKQQLLSEIAVAISM